MWIVAIGWIYVVALMAATEPTVLAGIMTFFGYCVLPLSILFYLAGSKRRRVRRELAARQAAAADGAGASVEP
jgi:cytochrome c biogenesis protein CcdA